jgi:5'-3' exonuclease
MKDKRTHMQTVRKGTRMKTLDEIKYEINFIENEIVNRDFTYLKVEELESWLVALQWTLKNGEGNE